MKLTFIEPREELKAYVSQLWLFESVNGLAAHGTLIAPNGKPKIIIPYKSVLSTTDHRATTVCKENSICFIGVRDVPVTLGAPTGASGSIGVELTTAGGYKFLDAPMSQLANTLLTFDELYGRLGYELQQKIMNVEVPMQKVARIQEFLLEQLRRQNRKHQVMDYSVGLISSMHGMVELKELEKKTGYSKRYLDMLFKQYVGISPKTLSTIFRFQRYYKYWSGGSPSGFNKQDIFEQYYDQTHFIKEFKRYTGYTPAKFARLNNDFGKNF